MIKKYYFEKGEPLMEYLQIAIKLIIGSTAVFFILRLMGKKTISDLTPFDLIYTLVLSGTLENAIYDSQVSIFQALFAIFLWGAIIYTVDRILLETEKTSKIIEGEPSILIENGKINKKELDANHIQMEQLRKLLRQQGCYNVKEVYHAILEVNGDVDIILKSEKDTLSVLLIEEGDIDYDILKNTIGKNERWLRRKLEDYGYTDLNEIYYCEWLPNDELFIYPKSDLVEGDTALDQ